MKKYNQITLSIILFSIALFLQVFSSYLNAEPLVKIHYLGHSSFVLQFDNGVTVVTDYGHFNAWIDSGWDSPIYSIGDLVPDVMTYSHFHADHYDSTRIPDGVNHILTEFDTLTINGLEIKPVRTCETGLNFESNSSFIFRYKGFTLCHLADAQAQIINIENETVRDHIKEIIPDSLDLLFMTIEGQSQFIEEAENFIDLLKPRRIIPIHYWSTAYKRSFLLHLSMQNSTGKHYVIESISGANYGIYGNDFPAPVKVISLLPSIFEDVTSIEKESSIPLKFKLNQNYPNPFNPTTTIEFSVPTSTFVRLEIYDTLGSLVNKLCNKNLSCGTYSVSWNGTNENGNTVTSGIYLYRLTTDENSLSNKMVFLR